METIIRTFNVCKNYNTKAALNNVNVTINRGDIYGIIGSNGAGKTTLIRIIAGLVTPTSGGVEIFGDTDKKLLNKHRSKIGFIVETPALYLDMTAVDSMRANCLISGIQDEEKIRSLLQQVGLSDTGSKKVKDFSLGMKQRLSLAQAMVIDPEILILDEPTNGMDPQGIAEIREYLKKIAKENGVTILVSSHILTELQMLATRFGIIENGIIIDEFNSSDLNNRGKRIVLWVSDPAAARTATATLGVSVAHLADNKIGFGESSFFDVVKALVMSSVTFGIDSVDSSNLESYYISKVGK